MSVRGPSPTGFRHVAVQADRLVLGAHVALPLRHVPGDGTAVVRVGEREHTLRSWTFGERRRLLALADPRHGAAPIDGGWLLDQVVDLLVEPAPEAADREVLALACLAWAISGGRSVPPAPPRTSAARQTRWLVERTGWRWQDVDAAAASDVDAWTVDMPAAASPTEPTPDAEADGFRRFVLVED